HLDDTPVVRKVIAEAEICGINVEFLIDSGAVKNLIGIDTYLRIPFNMRPPLKDNNTCLVQADGRRLRVLGVVECDLLLDGKQLPLEAVVADVEHEGILGAEFLSHHQAMINFASNTMYFGKESVLAEVTVLTSALQCDRAKSLGITVAPLSIDKEKSEIGIAEMRSPELFSSDEDLSMAETSEILITDTSSNAEISSMTENDIIVPETPESEFPDDTDPELSQFDVEVENSGCFLTENVRIAPESVVRVPVRIPDTGDVKNSPGFGMIEPDESNLHDYEGLEISPILIDRNRDSVLIEIWNNSPFEVELGEDTQIGNFC
ncbi:unnamed protein product, partial [Owenia fusiformis]